MKKILKFVIPCALLSVAILCINKAYATDRPKEAPEKMALKDYQHSKNISSKDGKQLYQMSHFTSHSSVETSTFFFRVYEPKQPQDMINSASEKLSELLMPTDEKLWFILNRNNPEGLIFTNDQAPIRMGGENRSKDLYKLYQSIQSNTEQMKEIAYFEFEGQGLFLVTHEKGEEVYASEGASFILGVPSGEKLAPNEVILKMKERILALLIR
ncbi:hypothetical protein [Bacillus cytotoxicus]|uniref:hypothetical protein n=1 Tax=Bacillus cytotoxicus TaxID=580165 RepID=UPI0006606CFB|nr:hypothetical protein [Bacillus cytotoxicus]AWC37072.1 hypothetical protein CG481_012085 [Bacillus cytotoxicus]AWC61336.1 hypothetical protein CG474_012145 [Bacillus cytotoxicus]KMT49225.1 hypothetical protein TU51_15610 [Bacillus cytotoxicus]MDH2882446.1 hypothetical protein [Bacillus cytotoxicus]HDR7311525.1 hypothetical protein [Bacillus cytotoxicus]